MVLTPEILSVRKNCSHILRLRRENDVDPEEELKWKPYSLSCDVIFTLFHFGTLVRLDTYHATRQGWDMSNITNGCAILSTSKTITALRFSSSFPLSCRLATRHGGHEESFLVYLEGRHPLRKALLAEIRCPYHNTDRLGRHIGQLSGRGKRAGPEVSNVNYSLLHCTRLYVSTCLTLSRLGPTEDKSLF